MKHGKKYVDSAKLIDRAAQYEVAEALDIAVKTGKAKFDETFEVTANLNIDPKKTNVIIRGLLSVWLISERTHN